MAQQTRIELLDDLDGSAADETITFGLDGATYEIDLSAANADAFRKSVATFVDHATRAGRHKPGTKQARTTAAKQAAGTHRNQRERTRAIRTWASAAGYTVSDRGRIPAHIIDAYDRTH
jgi:hypothetical protein